MVRKGFSPFLTVFTRADHDTTTGVRFFPFTPPRSTADVKAIRALLDVMNITGNMHLQFGYIQSDESEIFTVAPRFSTPATRARPTAVRAPTATSRSP